MVPSAARSWIARAHGDNRALERELAFQESTVAKSEVDAAVVTVSHDHSQGEGHGHSHGQTHDHALAKPAAHEPTSKVPQ
jgi:hypothetical protein